MSIRGCRGKIGVFSHIGEILLNYATTDLIEMQVSQLAVDVRVELGNVVCVGAFVLPCIRNVVLLAKLLIT